MEFYTKDPPFSFDEDTTDTEDDSGIAEVSEISSSVDFANEDQYVPLDADSFEPATGGQQTQSQDALSRFFSYWWVK